MDDSPKLTLYRLSVSKLAQNYKYFRNEILYYPPIVHAHIIHELYKLGEYQLLREELSVPARFARLLKLGINKERIHLHQCFQSLINKTTVEDFDLCNHYVSYYNDYFKSVKEQFTSQDRVVLYDSIPVAIFLSEAGWLPQAEMILLIASETLAKYADSTSNKSLLFQCYLRLMHIQNNFCKFEDAEISYKNCLRIAKQLEEEAGVATNLAVLYSEYSALHILQSNYSPGFSWSMKALEALVGNMSKSSVVDILRQAAKACVLKRKFEAAAKLIAQAVSISLETFGKNHMKYADALIDYGFYLLNIDAVDQGVQVYESALKIREEIFEGVNLHVAVAHEDLAYAYYVKNYTCGHFDDAKEHSQISMKMLLKILPEKHLLLSSSKRVKALILEEIAIDSHNKYFEKKYLQQAHVLHTDALQLSIDAFTENNIQTAKHFGNLGRLYQTMRKYEKAEDMHLKAITIKEHLLGPDDYEVALSVGHLASLYNYDMLLLEKAEKLHLRSIDISVKLFGKTFSGLEYEYSGLIRLYRMQRNFENLHKYTETLAEWKKLRSIKASQEGECPFRILQDLPHINDTIREVFSM